MRRLTERDIHGNAICKKEISIDCNAQCRLCDYDYECFKKLADYEDAEEQGLLVKVECHCKDCKHVDFAGCKNKTCYCLEHECYMQEDDFCKYAERYKEEAEQKLESMQKGEWDGKV